MTETSADLDTTCHVALQKDRSTPVLGETGAGKTETITLLTYQMQASDDEPFVVFDYKGEYQNFLPHLRKLGDLINAGRGRNTQLVLGVQ